MTKERLMYLLYIKNQLNAKRRRFQSMIYYVNKQNRNKMFHSTVQLSFKGFESEEEKLIDYNPYTKMPKCITQQYASLQYSKAQKDMRAMTKEIKKVYKALDAHITWDWSGNVERIIFGWSKFLSDNDKNYQIVERKDFKQGHDKYVMDQCVESMLRPK